VRHGRARRLLPALPDGTLPAEVEAEVRGHLARCGRCWREMRELELSEALLRRLPRVLVPRVVRDDSRFLKPSESVGEDG